MSAVFCQAAYYVVNAYVNAYVHEVISNVMPDCTLTLSTPMQLKNAPDFTKVKVNAPIYKGSGGIEPSEERSQKQDKAAHGYAEVHFQILSCFDAYVESLVLAASLSGPALQP